MAGDEHTLSASGFAAAFPFHVVLDRELRIQQLGRSLQKSCPSVQVGDAWEDHFSIVKPVGVPLDYDAIRGQSRAVFLAEVRASRLQLRGQMLVEGEQERIYFLALPWVMDLGQLEGFNLEINDYPIHDATADFLFMIRSLEMSRADARRLASKLQLQSADLEQAKSAAEQASHAKSRFLASMSHEIRTPMNGVLGMADLVLRGELSQDQRECVEIIETSAKALLTLINDILDFSKVEAGMLEIAEVEASPRDLLRDAFDLFRLEVGAKGVELRVVVADSVPEAVRFDVNRVRQILVNLIGNAVKFTASGFIEVRVHPAADDVDTLRFEVEDTGIGMPEHVLPSVFDPFVQVDASRTRQYGGTGLGLGICKRLVELMNGRIGVTSEVGTGSVFWFELPVEACTARPQAHARSGDVAGVPSFGARVLVAEDNLVNQRVASSMLTKLGCSVRLVPDGEAAIRAVEEESFDLVFMDLQMPVLDGLSATRGIRALDGDRGTVPIVAMTANAMQEDADACAAAGMTGYVTKPISVDLVAAAIRDALPQ